MVDSPVKFASGVSSLTVEFTNSARDAAGNVTYNVESDLSGDPVADYQLLHAIMGGEPEIFSSREFSGLDPSEIDALEMRLIELAEADQNHAATGLRQWMVNPGYQEAYYSRSAFKLDNYDPSDRQRNIGDDHLNAIENAVRAMHQNNVPEDVALGNLAIETEGILNRVSEKIQTQMDQVREFAAGNDVVATIVEAGAEITGASPVSATITNDPQAMYELFRNLEDTDLAGSPVYLALDAAGREELKAGLISASDHDYRHVTGAIFPYMQNAGNARHFTGEQIGTTFKEGDFNRASANRDIGQEYTQLIEETVARYQAVDYDKGAMQEINADFREGVDKIRQEQLDGVNSVFDDLAEQDQAHDVVALSVPTR